MEEAPFAIPFLCPLTILKCHQAELTNDSSMSSSFMYCLSLLHFHFHHSIAAKNMARHCHLQNNGERLDQSSYSEFWASELGLNLY